MALVSDFVSVNVDLFTPGVTPYIPSQGILSTDGRVDSIWQPAASLNFSYLNDGQYTIDNATGVTVTDESTIQFNTSSNRRVEHNFPAGGRIFAEVDVISSTMSGPTQYISYFFEFDVSNAVGIDYFPSSKTAQVWKLVGGSKTFLGAPITLSNTFVTGLLFDSTQLNQVGFGVLVDKVIYIRPADIAHSIDARAKFVITANTSTSQITNAWVNAGNRPFTYVIPSGYFPFGIAAATATGGSTPVDPTQFVNKNFIDLTTTNLENTDHIDATGSVTSLTAPGTTLDGLAGVYRKRRLNNNNIIVEFWGATTPVYAYRIYFSSLLAWSVWAIPGGSGNGGGGAKLISQIYTQVATAVPFKFRAYTSSGTDPVDGFQTFLNYRRLRLYFHILESSFASNLGQDLNFGIGVRTKNENNDFVTRVSQFSEINSINGVSYNRFKAGSSSTPIIGAVDRKDIAGDLQAKSWGGYIDITRYNGNASGLKLDYHIGGTVIQGSNEYAHTCTGSMSWLSGNSQPHYLQFELFDATFNSLNVDWGYWTLYGMEPAASETGSFNPPTGL